MKTQARRTRSCSVLDCRSGSRKRKKLNSSPEVVSEEASSSETSASSKAETACSPSSSSRASMSTAVSQLSSQGDDIHLWSPNSSNDCENRPCPKSLIPRPYNKSKFSRLSRILNHNSPSSPSLPLQLKVNKWGSPQKFWDVLCERTKRYPKSLDWAQYHPDLTREMRYILLEWLMEVADDLSLGRESFYLAVDYIDRFFSLIRDVRKSDFQLIGATALFLAAKYEEVEPPRLNVFVDYGDGAYNELNLRESELLMLRALSWQMNPITPLHWLRIYMQLVGFNELKIERLRIGERLDRHILQDNQDPVLATSNFPRLDFLYLAKVLDLCILDYDCLCYDPDVLSAAVFSHFFSNDRLTEEVTGYKVTDLAEARSFVEPYFIVCERSKYLAQSIKIRRGVHDEEMHNIQTLDPQLADLVKEAKRIKENNQNGYCEDE